MSDEKEDQIKSLRQEIKLLRNDVQLLTEIVQKLSLSCSKMDEHISFVEGVYSVVRTPANYIKGKIDRLMGKETIELPERQLIKNENNSVSTTGVIDEVDW